VRLSGISTLSVLKDSTTSLIVRRNRMIDFHIVVTEMVPRVLMTFILLVQLACVGVARPDARWIKGTYRNHALGYSIKIPRGLRGTAGDQAGPERGVRISLASGGEIAVFGEPNSLEWKSPEEGVRAELTHAACASAQQEVKQARVGKLSGAKANFICGDRVLKVFLAFRAGGSPVYWLRLETVRAHELEDDAILESIAASFRLIRWE